MLIVFIRDYVMLHDHGNMPGGLILGINGKLIEYSWKIQNPVLLILNPSH